MSNTTRPLAEAQRMEAGPAMAALRDASWWNRPNTSGPKKYHIDRGGGWSACCDYMMLVDDTEVPAASVPTAQRCRRPGCKQRWPAAITDTTTRGAAREGET